MKRNRRNLQSGFTLLEILLVVVIIGLLVGVAVVRLGARSGEAKKVAAARQIDAYKTALGLYELDNGFYPTSEQGLQSLIVLPTSTPVPNNWKGPYLDPPVLRKDPWGNDYIYAYPGTRNPVGYDLFSPGINGVEGDDDDIGNWQ
ncbi:MAG: type II secretion system protein GspG [Verrucomicrobia bacterium]|nr:type II secretion system protein GspG [Verrucomicrobiota bacterium]